jgi:endogenous inhibitor of DNA gyrase (YacG/DUF329 family)
VTALPQSVRCPICRKEAPWKGNPHRPFCSERCKLQDLGAWASERYRIRGEPLAESAEPANGEEPAADDEDE